MAQKRRVLPLIAIATFAVSWFVPVHRAGAKIGAGELPGGQAFRLALSRITEIPESTPDQLPWAVLAPASALTNFFFVIAAIALLRGPGRPHRIVKWGSLLCVPLNMFWLVLGNDRGDLLLGYYLWMVSFVLLAVAAFGRSGSDGRV